MTDADRIQSRITDDGLELWVRIDEGSTLGADALHEHVADLGVGVDLIPEALARLTTALESTLPLREEICLAVGERVQPAEPRKILLCEPSGLQPGTLREDDSLEFRERRLIIPVTKGDRLAEIYPAKPGKPGQTVLGDAIEPTDSPELVLRFGDGVRLEDERYLLADRDGARTVSSDGTIDVVDLYSHPGHVDFRSGNLISEGSIHVARDVSPRMTVQASADIMIGGTLDGGRLVACGGVEVKGGAIGRDSGSIQSSGDVRIRHALGIEIRSNGRLTVERSVSTSSLCAREIVVSGKALSDSLRAETLIQVKSAGSPAGGPCLLSAASPLATGEAPIGIFALQPLRVGGPRPARRRKKRSGRALRAAKISNWEGACYQLVNVA